MIQALRETSRRIGPELLAKSIREEKMKKELEQQRVALPLQPSHPAPSLPPKPASARSDTRAPHRLPRHIRCSIKSFNCSRRSICNPPPPAAFPLSAPPTPPFHDLGQTFWSVITRGNNGELLLNMTFGVEEQGLFDEAFLSMRRRDVEAMMTHSFDNYLKHGFPADEVKPMSCSPHNMFLADGGGNGAFVFRFSRVESGQCKQTIQTNSNLLTFCIHLFLTLFPQELA
jgi:hypothetical protein